MGRKSFLFPATISSITTTTSAIISLLHTHQTHAHIYIYVYINITRLTLLGCCCVHLMLLCGFAFKILISYNPLTVLLTLFCSQSFFCLFVSFPNSFFCCCLFALFCSQVNDYSCCCFVMFASCKISLQNMCLS